MKCFEYTLLKMAKSPMSFKKQEVFVTLFRLLSAATGTANKFFITCSVCSIMSPFVRLPVVESIGI